MTPEETLVFDVCAAGVAMSAIALVLAGLFYDSGGPWKSNPLFQRTLGIAYLPPLIVVLRHTGNDLLKTIVILVLVGVPIYVFWPRKADKVWRENFEREKAHQEQLRQQQLLDEQRQREQDAALQAKLDALNARPTPAAAGGLSPEAQKLRAEMDDLLKK